MYRSFSLGNFTIDAGISLFFVVDCTKWIQNFWIKYVLEKRDTTNKWMKKKTKRFDSYKKKQQRNLLVLNAFYLIECRIHGC